MNLRQRIRPVKIRCQPWKIYGGEIALLPVSAQYLFANNGLNWDVLEIELKEEAWLLPDENLWEVISTEAGLKRELNGFEDDGCPFDESWTEEDYRHYYESGGLT